MKMCIFTMMINLTTFPWNAHDIKTKERVKERCATDPLYKDTPCLARFIKKGKLNYHAICGPKKEEK
jgi:hypothetical protein